MEAFSGGLFLLLFLQWSRGHARARWRGLSGLQEQKPSLGPVAGKAPETPGQAAKVRPAWLGGPGLSARGFRLVAFGFRLSAFGFRLSAFGFWLLAFGFWLSARMGAGFVAAGWRRFSGKPLASGPCPVRNRPRRAPFNCRTRAPETALISLLL